MISVLQDWVLKLGLRHQGVLLTVVRGCDTAPKDDPSKLLCRAIRSYFLNAFCGDAKKSSSFIEHVDLAELYSRMKIFRKNLDHYPHHYLMHLIHAVEIMGYKHPDMDTQIAFYDFYQHLCKGLHMNAELEFQLDQRLGADEQTFAKTSNA